MDNWKVIAEDVAKFVLALGQLPPEDGPLPTRRGTPMAQFDEAVQWGISQLNGVIDVDRARQVWRNALEPGEWLGDPAWVHGDLLPGNILIDQGRLSGIIDWSCAGVGDPACEAMLAEEFDRIPASQQRPHWIQVSFGLSGKGLRDGAVIRRGGKQHRHLRNRFGPVAKGLASPAELG